MRVLQSSLKQPVSTGSSFFFWTVVLSLLLAKETYKLESELLERNIPSETVVSLNTVDTCVTWLISRTEFSSSELVL